jgi:regulator of sigma E protease
MVDILYAIIAAVVGLGILIIFHEYGHLLVAKMSGVGVLTFSVGFGPKLWVKKVGETEYALSAFPLGGYVKMVGEDPEEEVAEADIRRSFSHQGLAKRLAIVVAGPGFNLLLAVIIYSLVFMFYGVAVLTTQVGSVEPDSPAAQAGIQKGDRILSIDGQAINDWEELSGRIKASEGKTVSLHIQRDQQEIEITVQPEKREAMNVFGESIESWLIGITSETSIEKSGTLSAVGQGLYQIGQLAKLTLVGFFKLVTGEISSKNIGGPILIAQVAGQQAQEGLRSFLSLLAFLSVTLGVLNLLPIPVLDGGHVFFFLIEGILGRPIQLKYREKAWQIGFFILILIMLFATYNDIARFFEG